MTDLQIIGAPQSPYVWVTRIACTEKGVPHALVPAYPHTPDVNAVHPFGKIPVLRHGDVALCESRAISLYVDRVFDGPSLIPTDPVTAARTEQWVSLLITHVDRTILHGYVVPYYFPEAPDGTPNRAQIEKAVPDVQAQMRLFDSTVSRTGHLVGGSFTLADAYLMAFLFYLNKLPESSVALAGLSHLRDYFDRHMRRPSLMTTTPPAFEREPMRAAEYAPATAAA
jgi:glutathione S-transferase